MPRGDSSAERIRGAALELFSRHGVSGTSLRMIADELGVTKAAVYYHFRSKEDIVRAVLAPAFETFADLVDAAEQLPAPARPAALVEGLAHQAVRHRALYAVVLQDVSAAELRHGTEDARTFRRLRDMLAGPEAGASGLVAAASFLSGLMAPVVDPDVAGLEDAELEAALVAAGHRLLGVRPR